MIPYYTISNKVGHSDKNCKVKFYRLNPFYCIQVHEFEICQNESIEWIEQVGHTRFNPFMDLQHGGSLFGFKNKNYWISDDCWFGKIIKKLIENR